ncbi:MAG: hypothetical protein ACOCXQ_00375 [Patescibacteria group bacterium]
MSTNKSAITKIINLNVKYTKEKQDLLKDFSKKTDTVNKEFDNKKNDLSHKIFVLQNEHTNSSESTEEYDKKKVEAEIATFSDAVAKHNNQIKDLIITKFKEINSHGSSIR